ncbi:MAG TPA: hypothetical protein DCP31_20645 [Cyanobacteria bacterium UBA8543]|nr:hypothetical protein [Cyanobacteria bacterium UBA8543]
MVVAIAVAIVVAAIAVVTVAEAVGNHLSLENREWGVGSWGEEKFSSLLFELPLMVSHIT